MSIHPRNILVIGAVALGLGAPALQAMTGFGLSAAEFAGDGNGTLRAAGYAFSIWSLIYAGLVAYAVWQTLPRNRDDPRLAAIARPSVVAILGCGLWICASALDLKIASVGIIVVSALALTIGLWRTAARDADLKSRFFVWWPLSLLAGWLTIASALNILTVLTAIGALEGVARAAAFAGVVAVLIVALFVLRTGRLAVYGIPIAWGLVAVWVAEKDGKPDVAAVALGAAVLVGCYAAWQARPSAARR